MHASIPRGPARWAGLAIVALAALLLRPPPAAAQTECDPRLGCAAQQEPVVTLSPAGESVFSGVTAQHRLVLTISWCDPDGPLDLGSRRVYLDDNLLPDGDFIPVASLKAGCLSHAAATDTVLLPSGTHVVTSSIRDGGGAQGSGGAEYTYRVTTGIPQVAAHAPARATAGQPGMQLFTVRNLDVHAGVFTLAGACESPLLLSSCAASAPRLALAAGDSATVGVGFRTMGATGPGTVRLTAHREGDASVSATATAQASVSAAPAGGRAGGAGDGTSVERSLCLTVSVAPASAYECGDLRVVHGLPGVRLRNRARAPTLVYNSQHAHPYPVAAADHTPTGAAPDTVVAVLRVSVAPDSTVVHRSAYPGWAAGTTKRVAVGFDATGLPTSAYDYVLEIFHKNADEKGTLVASHPGTLAVVNRRFSQFGAGWWVAGVEMLMTVRGQHLLWVGGDGSTRLYVRTAADPSKWAARAPVDRPDTLYYEPSGRSYRKLPGGTKVWFDAGGWHESTENVLGDVTRFVWSANGFLEKIVLPDPAYEYRFEFNNTYSRLSRVVSPGPDSVRSTRVLTDASGRIERITDPSGDSVRFTYRDATARIHTRTDRRGTLARFWFDPGSRLMTVQLPHPVAGQTATSHFIPQETIALRSVYGPRDTAQVFTAHNGFRDDASAVDHTYFWLDRWGAPVRIHDALLNRTEVTRGDPRYPALVTRVVQPNGRETSAAYDARGNLAASTDWSTVATHGRAATTTYRWDPKWDAVTETALPEGETTRTQLDTLGRPAWIQPGPDPARRTHFDYYPKGDTFGLVRAVWAPGAAAPERYRYDGRGNLSRVETPLGHWTEWRTDRLGRVAETRAQIDDTLFVSDTTVYDAADRVRRQETRAPMSLASGVPVPRAGFQKVVAASEYDAEGAPLAVSRWSDPDVANVGVLTTRWTRDALGRAIRETAPDSMVDYTFYDAAGNIDSVRTRNGKRIEMTYDAMNRLKTRVVPEVVYGGRLDPAPSGTDDWVFPRFARDVNGNPTIPVNQSALGAALASLTVPADTSRFTYDAMGALRTARNRDAFVERTYFANGALQTETQTVRSYEVRDTTSHVYTLRYAYDLNGRRHALTHPAQLVAGLAGNATVYGYDAATGALETVADPRGNLFRYHYNARGEPDSLVAPGGIRQAFGYDEDGRQWRHEVMNGSTSAFRYGPNVLRDERRTFDARGKVLRAANLYGAGDTLTATYSGLGHLGTSELVSRGSYLPTGDPTQFQSGEIFHHDALGNVHWRYRTSNLAIERQHTNFSFGTGTSSFLRGRLMATRDGAQVDTMAYDSAGNLRFSRGSGGSSGGPRTARASFYGADGLLRIVDARRRESGTDKNTPIYTVFEEYRYDALGRRVMVRTRRLCENVPTDIACGLSTIRRTVWDGDAELWEMQLPGGEDDDLANDTQLHAQRSAVTGFDPNRFFGRVMYTHGLATDQPLGVTRVNYADLSNSLNDWKVWDPFTLVPLWNMRGQPAEGVFAHDGGREHCTSPARTRCVRAAWPQGWFAYARMGFEPDFWHGTLVEDKGDASGFSYRRNRYYDPQAGRFTQEDPIGLAGGLNVYGFAAGDPVSYSDPYGLCPLWVALVDGPQPGPADLVALGMCATMFVGTVFVASEASHAETRRAARRQSMRDFGIPTSRPPDNQCRSDEGGYQYQYEERDFRGNSTGRTNVVEHHNGDPTHERAADRMNHWESGEAKDPRRYGTRNDGTYRTRNNKRKCTYGVDPGPPAPQ